MNWKKPLFEKGKITVDQQVQFYRQIAIMAAAGNNLSNAIRVIAEEGYLSVGGGLITSIKEEMDRGTSLEDIFSKHPQYFKGIPAGVLANEQDPKKVSLFFKQIADLAERRELFRKEVAENLKLPLIVICVAILINVGLLTFVIPAFKALFNDTGGTLPWATQAVISVSDWVQEGQWMLYALMVGLIFLYKKNKKWVYGFASKLPLLGPIFNKMAVIEFLRQMPLMLSFDISFQQGIRYAAQSMSNPFYAEKLELIAQKVFDKGQLKDALGETKIFPGWVLQFIGVGERVDALREASMEAAAIYEKGLNRDIHHFLTCMNILFLTLLGIGVGFLVIAMYLPIFNLASVVG